MDIRPRTIVLIEPSRALDTEVRRAFDTGERVVVTPDAEEAEDWLRRAPYGSVTILSGNGGDAAADIRSMKSALPEVPVLGALEEPHPTGRMLWELCAAGCDEFIVLPDDREAKTLRHRVEHAIPDDILAIYEEANPDGAPGRAKQLLHQASRIGTAAGFPRDLAAHLHVSTATLARWFQRGGLPTPRTTLLLVRMLSAARMLENDQRPIGEIARAVGYSTPQAFRKALREVVGTTPTRLRADGAYRTVRQVVARYLTRS